MDGSQENIWGEKNNKLKRSRKEKKFEAKGIKANMQKKINNRACAAQRILIDMEDNKIQAETGSVNNNQRGHERGKDCEEVLLNDKQQAEINGGNVTCEEWRRG